MQADSQEEIQSPAGSSTDQVWRETTIQSRPPILFDTISQRRIDRCTQPRLRLRYCWRYQCRCGYGCVRYCACTSSRRRCQWQGVIRELKSDLYEIQRMHDQGSYSSCSETRDSMILSDEHQSPSKQNADGSYYRRIAE